MRTELLVSKQKICDVSRHLESFTSENMDSEQQEEQKPVRTEFIEEYSENKSDPDLYRMKDEVAEEERGWCLFLILH